MTSPFKFLDAFEQSDKAIFFGRDAEIEQLYRLVFEANLVLVYGQSGTGKTSLIQCGLANRFAETDWFQLFVRRTDDINRSLTREIRNSAVTPIPDDATTVEAIRSLFLDHLRPIYLIFDQFEELFVLGTKQEQDAFFTTVAAILASDVSCKIIISLREEYLASLHRFEEAVPSLFNKRLRIEPMSMTNVEQVIVGTTGALGIQLENGKATARRIVDQLDDGRVGVQLAYLQVYLDSLYHRAAAKAGGGLIVFNDAAVEETGKLGDIMAGFLDDQTARIGDDVPGIPKHGIEHLLEQFVTVDGTKQPSSRAELIERLPDAAPWIDAALAKLQSARIVRDVDGRFELAHDALAGRICEARSGERKAMLMVQKIVRDRTIAFPQTRTWLSAEELALVSRSRRKDGERLGAPSLELTPDELNFVKKSTWKQRWRKYRFVAGLLVVSAFMLLAVIVLVVEDAERDEKAVAATNETDWLAYRSYSILKNSYDESLSDVRRDLLVAEAELNTNREFGLIDVSRALDNFWNELAEADLALEDGDPATAKAVYHRLAKEWRSKLAVNEYDLRARVRLKAILWRQHSMIDNEDEGGKMLGRILDVITPVENFDPVDFSNDVNDACVELERIGVEDPRCRKAAAVL
ncbi:MAG: ATP-binding protein [Sphingomicrobium sp.]